MANQLYDDFRERGFVLVHVLIDNPYGFAPTWEDAHDWAYHHFGYTLRFPVIADTDGAIWNRFTDPDCQYTPNSQFVDQGRVTFYDPCNISNDCNGCGYDDADTRLQLDQNLPKAWCGEATE